MRNYLKTKGINLNKAKSWTLTTCEDYDTEDLVVRSWITENNELYYTVKQANLVVKFRGQSGMEDVKSYSDTRVSFIVDSVANDLRLQAFVARWVNELRKENYIGSWTLKKQRKAMKLAKKERRKSMKNLGNALEFMQRQRDNSVKYRSVKPVGHGSLCVCLKCYTKKKGKKDRSDTLPKTHADYDDWDSWDKYVDYKETGSVK